jgi:hypothetical protein
MNSAITHAFALALVTNAVTYCAAADEPLTRVQIARIGKAATALVEVKAQRGQGTGSAFCIHPDGWFLTNAHVAQGALTLVLNSGLKAEKAYTARVVRSDAELDLALLHIDGAKDLPALALGSDEGLEEQMDAMAFGFPLVESSSRGRGGRPSVSVNSGSITALRRQDDRLKEIQLDIELNPGNSGSPVLDNHGKVIGVVRTGLVARDLGRTGINQAIPVSAVARFLTRPEVKFNPPPLRPSNLHKPVTFEARVTPLLPSASPLTVELILKAGKVPERKMPLEAVGDRYRVTTTPLPGPPEPRKLRLVARFDNARIESTTSEQAFTIGGRKLSLGDVRSIRPGSPSLAVMEDSETITGTLAGLDAVPTRLGGQTLTVDLVSAKEVIVSRVDGSERVGYTLVVRQGEKEIYRQSRRASGNNLLKNPGFEDGLEGWSTHVYGARPRIEFDQSIVREGRQSLCVEANKLSDTAFGQNVMLKPGQWYRFSGWVRTRRLDPHGSPVYGTFQVQLPTGYTAIGRGTNHEGDTEWSEVSILFQPPPGGLTRFAPFLVGFGKGTGTAWFDDLNLIESDPPTR